MDKNRNLVSKVASKIKYYGIKYTLKKIRRQFYDKMRFFRRRAIYTTSRREQKRQHSYQFPETVKVSILVPLYNTPHKFLAELIDSVQNQTYANWELCLVDASDEKHKDVGRYVDNLMKDESRIVYKKLEENWGISGNTNEALALATGDYIGLLDHDDRLHPYALFEIVQVICNQGADFIYSDEITFKDKISKSYGPNFKPDYSPDTLRSYNYICHFSVFKRKLIDKVGRFKSEYDGSQDYDMILRLTERAQTIVHIPKVLYFWRAHAGSVAMAVSAKNYTIEAAKKALAAHLKRVGLEGKVHNASAIPTYHIEYKIEGNPLISILIPNKDHSSDLKKCLESIDKSTYKNYELIIIENSSVEEETFNYYRNIEEQENLRIINWASDFNYSAINNWAAQEAKGKYLLFLNNDIEIITPNWLEEMLMFAQRKDVGAVGAKLYYEDDTVQHAGVIVGLGGVAGHAHKYIPRDIYGYMYRASIVNNLSAVTAACLMISTDVFNEVEGFDTDYAVAFNDIDMCMRIRSQGYLNIYTPFAELYHYESKSRGFEDTKEKKARLMGEVVRFKKRWEVELSQGDPYYNPNLTMDKEDFSVR